MKIQSRGNNTNIFQFKMYLQIGTIPFSFELILKKLKNRNTWLWDDIGSQRVNCKSLYQKINVHYSNYYSNTYLILIKYKFLE